MSSNGNIALPEHHILITRGSIAICPPLGLKLADVKLRVKCDDPISMDVGSVGRTVMDRMAGAGDGGCPGQAGQAEDDRPVAVGRQRSADANSRAGHQH